MNYNKVISDDLEDFKGALDRFMEMERSMNGK